MLVIITSSIIGFTVKYTPKASTPEYPSGYPRKWEVCVTRGLLFLFAKNDDCPLMVDYIFPTSRTYELKTKIETYKRVNPQYDVFAYRENENTVICCDVDNIDKQELKLYLPQVNCVVNGVIEKVSDNTLIRFVSYYNFENYNNISQNVLFKLVGGSFIPIYPARLSSFYMGKIGNDLQDSIVLILDSIIGSIDSPK